MDEFDAVVDQVIEAAGGNLRAAIAGLVRGQHAIADDITKTVSAGYVRRGLR
ncbi:hypothetical protein GCM10011335_28970 [Aureimonas glaciei]|uniref:Uncharacterized protein n=1 Tax=Aureimonas glaciei TaxID=1776957 RepID=A0A917DBY4_9HYPH|nr:hypothetical protein GCM10011335_28970 [Aureimonas glaciei]